MKKYIQFSFRTNFRSYYTFIIPEKLNDIVYIITFDMGLQPSSAAQRNFNLLIETNSLTCEKTSPRWY